MNSVTQHMRSAAGFCTHGPSRWSTSTTGPLLGQRLAVKDLYAIEGYPNAAGCPDWLSSHRPASETATAIRLLMDEGAEFAGFTHTDELAYSLEGNNEHYGKTENPKLRGHASGGSSMGSAAAVASHWADIGLGTDTGGSVRVPASYCGLFGIRPSHGAVSTHGLIGLAPRFDTVGWFTQDPELLNRVGHILVPKSRSARSSVLVFDEQLFELVDSSLKTPLVDALARIAPCFDQVRSVDLGLNRAYHGISDVFRVLQGRAIANYHGKWIDEVQPSLSAAVQARIDMALAITDSEVRDAEFVRASFKSSLSHLLVDDVTLFLPTTPTTAPALGEDTTLLRPRLLTLTAIAGLTGSAQVHLPLMPQAHGRGVSHPYGFSLLQLAGNDYGLLNLTEAVTNQWNGDLNR